MIREEALNILHNTSVYHPGYLDALNMAIEALEQEPKTDTWSIKDVANTLAKHGLIEEQEPCEDAVPMSVIEEIKAEINAYLQAEGFGSEYRNDVVQIIDKHIGKEGSAE